MSPGPPGPSDPPPLGKPSVETAIAIIDHKLRTGTITFGELRNKDDELATKIGVLEERMRPKPTNWLAVISTIFGIAMALGGILWTLAWLFGDRPTRDEFERDITAQRQQIDTITTEQRALHDQQIEQRTLLKSLGDAQAETNKKLDYLISHPRGGGGHAPP